MGHTPFMAVFEKMVILYLTREESNEYASRGLKFLSTFIASFGDEVARDGGSHPLIAQTFNQILDITSKQHHVRARICMLVAQIMTSFSQRAEIDETIMDGVIERMTTTFIRDISPLVRAAAILALQRLQDPENSEDQVTRAYIYHMETDPVGKVRQAAITAIAKKLPVIANIIERLQDNDEKVRRHTYMQMASFPVKSYKIADRIKILFAGLFDRSDMVKKAVNNILLPNWIAAYDNDYYKFAKAIKLDSNDKDLLNFRNLAQLSLLAIFRKRKLSELIEFLQLTEEKCLTVEKANHIEWLVMWKVVMKLHLEVKSGDDEEEENSDDDEMATVQHVNIMPELSVLCEFFEKFTADFKSPEGSEAKYQKLNFNHCIIILLEIVQLNDFSDVIGCEKLKALMKTILVEHEVSEEVIKEIAHVVEQIVPTVEARLNYFNEIVTEMVKPGGMSELGRKKIIDDLIAKADNDTKVMAASLKMQMMELKEQEITFVERKQYANAQQVRRNFVFMLGFE
jgi:condensin complex subunit 3